MSTIHIEYTKLGFTIILLVFCIKFCDADFKSVKSFDTFDFEQVRNSVFIQNIPTKFSNESISRNDRKCLEELSAIRHGLIYMEIWAMKIVDSWGKMPSGILEGTTYNGTAYDFGTFSECFHIKRNDTFYESKYCFGQLDIDSKNMSISLPHFKFGLCVPAVCSLDLLQNLINIDHPINGAISISLLENTCQFEENPSGQKTIDWITIGLLGLIAMLVVMSTTYDILCTVHNREKTRLLLAFSFYSNGKKLFSCEQSKSSDVLHCLHGIRVISTAWIVLYHTSCALRYVPIQNMTFLSELRSRYHNMFVFSGPIAVDSFLVLSGMLVSIGLLKKFDKENGRINIPMFYLHRYLRLTPLMAIALLISISLLRFLGSGPVWPREFVDSSGPCERNWLSTLLYAQNYVNPDDLCLLHVWYLSVDMQLFIISPVIVYLIYRFKTKALVIMGFSILAGMVYTVIVHEENGINTIYHPLRMDYYVPTHIRFPSWLIGVITGYFIYTTRGREFHIPKAYNLFAWACSLAVIVAVIFGVYPFEQMDFMRTAVEYGLYNALSRVAWSIAVSYMIFACVHNSGGIINTFLGHPLWQPLSSLSFAIYILHREVIHTSLSSMKATPNFSELTFYYWFISCYVSTVFLAIVAMLAIESPISILDPARVLFGLKKKSEPVKGV